MKTLVFYIPFVVRVTFSAYRRLPIRWRLAGGSAALTLVILCGFATVVGVLTMRQIESDFQHQVREGVEALRQKLHLRLELDAKNKAFVRFVPSKPDFADYATSPEAAIRVITEDNSVLASSPKAPNLGPPRDKTTVVDGWQVETRVVPFQNASLNRVYVQYARRTSEVVPTQRHVRLFLLLGVLGGAGFALLAGLSTARRAMAPIAKLTDTARRIGRTRDSTINIPEPVAKDEVGELATTLTEMLRSLTDARAETEAALTRQREFVADASHELRTPLTAVLPNLEYLEEQLEGDERDAAAAALRSSKRMHRIVADLLLLARADSTKLQAFAQVDFNQVILDCVEELENLAVDHQIEVELASKVVVHGRRDELHRLVANLISNAVRHTPAGTRVNVTVSVNAEMVHFSVEDDGPGIAPALRTKVFERFFRASSDRGGSSGLGLAIVRAVATSHGGNVAIAPPSSGQGTRIEVELPLLHAGSSSDKHLVARPRL